MKQFYADYQERYGAGILPLVILALSAAMTALFSGLIGGAVSWVWHLFKPYDQNKSSDFALILAVLLGPYYLGWFTQITTASNTTDLVVKAYRAGLAEGKGLLAEQNPPSKSP